MPDKRTNFHQRGQITILMMVAMIPALLLIVFIFNSGTLVAHKTKLQNTADTKALTEAAWTARTLNVMAMNNTGLAQSHAISSSAWALEGPLYKSLFTTDLIRGFYTGRIVAWTKKGSEIGGPWGAAIAFVISTLFFLALVYLISDSIYPQLKNVEEEVKRALHQPTISGEHQNAGSFARAAASMGRMNELLIELTPEAIHEHSAEIAQFNFKDSESYRYTAWAPENKKSKDLELPVKKIGIESFFSADTVEEFVNNAKDIKDVDTAGSTGTQTNPYNIYNVSTDYFGNFSAHGYPIGTGPFSLAKTEITKHYQPLQEEVEEWASGKEIKKALSGAVCGTMNSIGFGCECSRWNLICKAAKAIVNIFAKLFAALGGTIFQDPPMEWDLPDRFQQTWQWTTWYGEATYSNATYFKGWGMLLGLYNGYDFDNYTDTLKTQFDGTLDDLSTAKDKLSDNLKIQECFEENSTAAKNAKKDAYDVLIAQAIANNQPRPPQPSFDLSDQEKNEIQEECEKKVKEDPDLYKGDKPAPTNNLDPQRPDTEIPPTADGDKKKAENNKGAWLNIREYFVWPYESIGWKGGISLPLGADAWPLLLKNPDKNQDNYLCRDRFPKWAGMVPSGLCTHETPFYALTQIRIAPEKPITFNIQTPSIRPLTSRADWGLLVAVKRPLKYSMANATFDGMPQHLTAIAQAEIYNTQWFDDFTQRWRAKLVPVTLLDDQDHRRKIIEQWNIDLKIDSLFRLTATPDHKLINH